MTTPLPDDPVRWQAVKALFEEAVAHPPGTRTPFLDAACRDADGRPDPGLRRAVEALLQADSADDAFLGASPAAFLPQAFARNAGAEIAPGHIVGPYRVLDHLGEGGMGEVFLAERADGLFEQRVALKLVKRGMDTDAVLRRFEAERRILARLAHPGIARLYAGGATDDGRPWFAMEYVSGTPLTAYAAAHGLGLGARLDLFEGVCEAVRHAHARLVVHRDLKPSNVLVAEDEGGRPQVKLLDFGIARLLDADGERSALTAEGAQPMTRTYAAPEQIRGEPATTATDVYALGILLYELLTGRRPFEAPSPAALETAILHEEPARPSRAARQEDGVAPSRLRGDLDTVVLKALRKAPEDRYAGADALLEDVRRHRTGLPLAARPPSVGYRMRLFARRHPTGVAVTAVAVLLLLAGGLFYTARVTAERDAAETTAAFLEGLFATASPYTDARQDTLRVRDLLDLGLARAEEELADQPHVRARLALTIGEAYIKRGMHPKAETPLTEAVAFWRAAGDPALLARSLIALGEVRDSQLRYEDGEGLFREALALTASRRDDDLHASAENGLGRALRGQGRYDEAEALVVAALARLRARHGSRHPMVNAMEGALAFVFIDQGRFGEAEVLLLALHDRYAADDPRRLDVLSPLTFLYLASGRVDEAAATGAEAVALSRALRPGSSTMSQVLAAYAGALRRQGRLPEAEAAYREALALPPMRPEAHAVPLGGIASVLADQGDLEGAVEAQRQATALLRAAGSPSALFSTVKLAGFLRDLGRYAEAEQLLLEAEAAGPPTDRHAGGDPVRDALAALYEAWGRPEDAARWRARPDG